MIVQYMSILMVRGIPVLHTYTVFSRCTQLPPTWYQVVCIKQQNTQYYTRRRDGGRRAGATGGLPKESGVHNGSSVSERDGRRDSSGVVWCGKYERAAERGDVRAVP